MNKEKRKTLIVSVLGLIISLAGVSYAFFRASVMGSESNSTIYGVAANLTIEFREGTSQISASDIFPGWCETKTFYIKNNNSAEGEYSLKLFDVENGFMEESISFEITSTNGGASVSKRNLPASDELLEEVIVIAGNTTQEYTVKVYYNNLDVDQSADLGKNFTFKIGIDEAIKAPAPSGWYKAPNGTLLAGIKANYSAPTEPLTTPGAAVSTSDEAVMAAAPDDYGTSYYFRGNVQNNYVVFANMCWRIVRVTGDGSIKLVLYNYSSTDCTETGDDLAFARYNGNVIRTLFIEPDYMNTGFMYGNVAATTYAEIHKNINKSTILTKLETWYETNIALYEDRLADTIWCSDKSESSETNYYLYFGSYDRYQNVSPNLSCPNDNDGGKLSKFTVNDIINGNGDLDYKIGLLTIDEVVYAGLKWETTNPNNNYLLENAFSTTAGWFTLSPSKKYRTGSCMSYTWMVYKTGDVNWMNSNYEKYRNTLSVRFIVDEVLDDSAYNYIRPAISLKRNTTISSGTGTASAPFVIS